MVLHGSRVGEQSLKKHFLQEKGNFSRDQVKFSSLPLLSLTGKRLVDGHPPSGLQGTFGASGRR